MNLGDWQKNGWLKLHTTSPAEIGDLLALAERDLKDCRARGLSDDWKFNIAYNAALQASSAALAASGYAVSKGDSNHFRVIQSLHYTLGLDAKAVDVFDSYRKKRSMSIYDFAGVISEAEAKQIAQFAADLAQKVRQWLRDEHPRLLPPESPPPKKPSK